MKFHQNYTGFWDHQETRCTTTQLDFVENMASFLEQHDIVPFTASAIAAAVFERMSDERLHYHTPVHVLSMFQFAQNEFPNETLASWEELAIWFHDSVYIPQLPGTSEDLSIMFMRAMINPAFSETEIAAAQFAIETTAQHLELKTNALYNTIMDLDVASAFLGDVTSRNAAIRKEFDYVDDATFAKSRKSFFNKMIHKGFIFRSDIFKERYEAEAMENIKKELEKLSDV